MIISDLFFLSVGCDDIRRYRAFPYSHKPYILPYIIYSMSQQILMYNKIGRIVWNQCARNILGREINNMLWEKYGFDDFEYVQPQPNFSDLRSRAFHMAYGYIMLLVDTTVLFSTIEEAVKKFDDAFQTVLSQ